MSLIVPETFIGTDIESVSRIETIINSSRGDRFISRIFTDREIIYCKSKSNPSIHFTGRFSAKEAITKALLSSGKIKSIEMKSIEIISAENRKPEVNLDLNHDIELQCKVSISHTNDYAVAFALIEIY